MSDNHPVSLVKIGAVSAAIFKNEGSNGSFHTATIERTYKDGDEWKTTTSYGTKDLAILGAVAQLALGMCIELDAAEGGEGRLEEAA